ncbi:MAG: hypothetical protein HKN29_06250 [Rhodothermales bacterium]|nr:hypothetical protein [Rhodothermales bacterium]
MPETRSEEHVHDLDHKQDAEYASDAGFEDDHDHDHDHERSIPTLVKVAILLSVAALSIWAGWLMR